MQEKMSMLSGQLYDASSDLLTKERLHAKELCHNYNTLRPSLYKEKINILKTLLGKAGKNITIEPIFFCDYGYNIEIGNNFYSNHNCVILDPARVTFGDNVFIGPNCGFYTAGHPFDTLTRNKGLEYARPISIGDNVWIGGNVAILPGVTIGSNTVIGAGSTVTKDIPSGVLATGNPCIVRRNIDS